MNIIAVKTKNHRRWFVGMALALCAGFAVAGTSTVTVSNARIRLLPGNLPLAGYFDAHNSSNKTISLTGASSPAFGRVMMHRSMRMNGQETMKMVMKVDIGPGKTIHFAPGGYHLMLMMRKHELKVGQTVPIKMTFSNGHSMEVKFRVGDASIK